MQVRLRTGAAGAATGAALARRCDHDVAARRRLQRRRRAARRRRRAGRGGGAALGGGLGLLALEDGLQRVAGLGDVGEVERRLGLDAGVPARAAAAAALK